MRGYRDLLRRAEVRWLAVIAVATRLAAPMLSISLVLAVVDRGGSYATAGLVLTGYAAALHQLVLGNAAPEHVRTEAFAWMGTFMRIGYALGTAAAGQLVSTAGNDIGAAFLAAGGAAALAGLLSLLVRTPRAAEAHKPEPTAVSPS